MTNKKHKGLILLGTASLGVAVNAGANMALANENNEKQSTNESLTGLLNSKITGVFSKIKKTIMCIISYIYSRRTDTYENVENEVKKLNDLWKEYKENSLDKETEEKLLDELLKKVNSYAKLLVDLKNLELRLDKNNEILIVNNDEKISLKLICELISELSIYIDIDGDDVNNSKLKECIRNIQALDALLTDKQFLFLMTSTKSKKEIFSEDLTEVLKSVKKGSKKKENVIRYLDNCYRDLKIKYDYLEKAFGKNFKPEKIEAKDCTKLKENIAKYLHKIKGRNNNDLYEKKRSIRDYNQSMKILFPNECKDLLVDF